jgi:hypothetical protein
MTGSDVAGRDGRAFLAAETGDPRGDGLWRSNLWPGVAPALQPLSCRPDEKHEPGPPSVRRFRDLLLPEVSHHPPRGARRVVELQKACVSWLPDTIAP